MSWAQGQNGCTPVWLCPKYYRLLLLLLLLLPLLLLLLLSLRGKNYCRR